MTKPRRVVTGHDANGKSVVIFEGEVVLVLEDSEVVLKKSDVVVQRGTNHAWENRSSTVARLGELLEKLPIPLELMR